MHGLFSIYTYQSIRPRLYIIILIMRASLRVEDRTKKQIRDIIIVISMNQWFARIISVVICETIVINSSASDFFCGGFAGNDVLEKATKQPR